MTQNRTAAEIINGEKPQTVNSFAGNPSNPIDDQVDALDMGTTVIPQLPFLLRFHSIINITISTLAKS
jgi:hypothetical protein